MVFGYFVALPAAVHYLTNYDRAEFNIQIRAKDYYGFVTMVLLAMGVVFEMPIFILALTRLGILTTRQLRQNRRIGYFVVAVRRRRAARRRPVHDDDRDPAALGALRGLDLALGPARPQTGSGRSSQTAFPGS